MGGGEELVGAGLLDPFPLVEHGDLIAPAAGHGQVVADQQQGAASFLAEFPQFGHHLARHGHIQAGGGFIGDHQIGLEGHGQGNGQPLTHAPAEFMGVAAVARWADPHPLQELGGPALNALVAPARAMGLEGVGQVVTNGEQGVEPGHGVLEHQAHRFPPQASEGGAFQLSWVLAGQFQLPGAAAALR